MPTFAAVDIGSNSVRLKIARLQGGRLRSLHEDREVTRLGQGVFGSGFLTPDSIADTVRVLRRFHRATQQIVTDSVRVVATSALRDARNSQAFLEWVRSATGWRVEIISGVEEARLIHLGLVSGSRIDRSPTLMMDLGGGSCELTVTQGGHIRDAVSLPLGAVRLTNEFLRHDPPRKGELKRLRGFVAREVNRVVDRIANAKVKNVIATSGTAAALAAVAGHMRRGVNRQRNMVSRAEMTRIAKRLARFRLRNAARSRASVRGALRSLSPAPLFITNCSIASTSKDFAIRRSACATGFSRRWRRITTAARARASRSNPNAGNRS